MSNEGKDLFIDKNSLKEKDPEMMKEIMEVYDELLNGRIRRNMDKIQRGDGEKVSEKDLIELEELELNVYKVMKKYNEPLPDGSYQYISTRMRRKYINLLDEIEDIGPEAILKGNYSSNLIEVIKTVYMEYEDKNITLEDILSNLTSDYLNSFFDYYIFEYSDTTYKNINIYGGEELIAYFDILNKRLSLIKDKDLHKDLVEFFKNYNYEIL